MNKKKETTVLLLSLIITIGAVAGGWWWFDRTKQTSEGSNSKDLDSTTIVPKNSSSDPLKFSTGDKILVDRGITPQKQSAVRAIADKNYPQAVSLLEESLATKRNDPEALVYLNNARIGDSQSYTIAVPAPIGTELTTAQEILRGVAQAQDEINQQGGIKGVPLKILLTNDNNDVATAAKVAQDLVKNKDVLGVIGHFSSGVTLATAPIYQNAGLVAISPTSTSVAISEIGNYIFRTVPSDRFTSKTISRYALETLNKNKIAIVYNSQSAYSKSLRDTFTTDIVSDGGEIVAEADLSQNNFNSAEILDKAKSQGAEVLAFLNDSKTADRAYLIMQLNNNQLPMLAGDSLYKPQTLQNAGEKATGLVLGVPWHILGNTNIDFPDSSRKLWGGDVNWRTAMAYDAVKAIAAGLENEPTRQGLQQTLSLSSFAFEGASGTVKFLVSGDRNAPVQLVTVQPGKRSPYGYDFVPVR